MNSTQEVRDKIKEKCYLTGNFTLRSGIVSHEYFDKYQFESDPELLYEIAKGLTALLPEETEVLAGLEVGGIPIATMIAHLTKIPTCFVRKKAKEYGTAKLAEGTPIKGKKVTIIEDVVTSGGQIILSTADLRERGAIITHALCVIDREQGGLEKLAEHGITLIPLFRKSEF